MIVLALNNNRDLRTATLNIERSRAQYQIKESDLFPQIEGVADGDIERIPKALSVTGQAETAQQFDAALGLSLSMSLTFLDGYVASRTRRLTSSSPRSRPGAASRSAWSPRLPPPT